MPLMLSGAFFSVHGHSEETCQQTRVDKICMGDCYEEL